MKNILLISLIFLLACSKGADLSKMPGIPDKKEVPPMEYPKDIVSGMANLIWLENNVKRSNIQVGEESSVVATLKNEGNKDSDPLDFSWLANQDEFYIKDGDNNCETKILKPQQECQVLITFRPLTEGTKNRSLKVNNQIAQGLTVWGSTEPEAGLSDFSVNITTNDFTTILTGSEADVLVSIQNTGSIELVNGSRSLSNEVYFSIIEDTCPQVLPVNNVCTLKVKYKPELTGNHASILSVKYSGQTKLVNIIGRGEVPVIGNPLSHNSNFTLNEDTTLNEQLIAEEPSGEEITYTIVSPVAQGTLILNPDGSFSYTPNLHYYGTDSFVFKVTNTSGLVSNLAQVQLTITPVNDAPVTEGQTVGVIKNEAKTIILVAGDVESSPLTYSFTNPSHGTLSGTPPNITYTPNNNYLGNDSFTFWVNDGELDSNISVVSINVSYTNYAPVTDNQFFNTHEDTVLEANLLASDANSLDVLTYIVVGNPTNGTLNLNSDGSFTYTPNANFNGIDFFTFKVNDGESDSNLSLATISVASVNDAPTVSDYNISVSEDYVYNGMITGNDVDNDPLNYIVVSQPEHGTLILNPLTGSYTYIPNLNYNGTDSFLFKVNDGNLDSNVGIVNITVLPENDLPIATSFAFSTNEDEAYYGFLEGEDLDEDELVYSLVSQGSKGTVIVMPDGSFTYEPNLNANGMDSFTYRVHDGEGYSNTATVNVTIIPVNDAPVANNNVFNGSEDTVLNASLTGTDVDGDELNYSIVSNPSHGSVSLNSYTGAFEYTPNLDYFGTDSFTFKVSDGELESNTATITLNIAPVNDTPFANSDTFSTNEDTALTDNVVGGDLDGDSVTYSIFTMPSNGSLVLNSTTGEFTYIPNTNYNGVDSFVFRTFDGSSYSAPATIAITVIPVNDLPVAHYNSFTINEDTILNNNVTATDPDSGDTLVYTVVSIPSHGDLILNTNGSFTYTPNSNYSGADYFTFRVHDGTGYSNTATVSLTIEEVNDLPVANNQSFSTDEDVVLINNLSASDTDGDTLTYSLVSNSSNGTISVVPATGTFTYTPNANYHGTDSFTYRVYDGTDYSNTATVSITVNSVNDVPIANDASFNTNEDTVLNGSLSASDADGDSLTYSVVSMPSHGTLNLNPTTGSFAYTPVVNYFGTDSFTFKVNDGTVDSNTATVSLNILPINDVPVANDDSFSVNEDTLKNGSLSASDPDNGSLTYEIVDYPTKGIVFLNESTGTYTYSPNLNENGNDSFSFRAYDGTDYSNTATVSITINPINDAPVALNSSYSTEQNTAIEIELSAEDVEGDALTYTITQQPTKGVLSGSGNSWIYTPNSGEIGSDSFKFKVNDGSVDSNIADISINIQDNGNWHLTAFQNRIKIHINNSTQGALQDMPVLVRLDPSRINYGNVNNNGSDIRFVSTNGEPLSYEIEKWGHYQESLVWVKIPTIDANSVVNYFWLYYNNPGATSEENPEDVWSNGYVAVYHLKSAPHEDSANGLDLAIQGSVGSHGTTKIGSGSTFSSVNGYLKTADNSLLNPNNLTIEVWANENYRQNNASMVEKKTQFALKSNNGKLKMEIAGISQETSSANLPMNTWKYITGVFDTTENTCKIYENGILRKSGTCNNNLAPSANALQIGSNDSVGFRGTLDEVRISSIPRSADWLQAQYLSMNDSLLIFGSSQNYGGTILKSQISVVKSSLDDGVVSNGTRIYTETEVRSGNGYVCTLILFCEDFPVWGYNRFQLNHAIPATANITKSVMRLYGTNTSGWNPASHNVSIRIQNAKNAGQVSGNNQCPGCSTNIPVVSNINWSSGSGLSWSLGTWNNSPDLKTQMEELVSGQSGLNSGGYVQIWTTRSSSWGNNVINIKNEDFTAEEANHSQLFIEWEE